MAAQSAHAGLQTPSDWVVRWAPLIPRAGRVLDLACGGGRHARHLAAVSYRVEAVDRDVDALARLAGCAGVTVRTADLEGGPWPYAGERFDGLASAVQVMGASAGSLLLLDAAANELVFKVIEGGGGAAMEGTRMPADKGIAGWVVLHREPLIVDDVNRDDRHYHDIARDYDYKPTSLLCVPMIARGQVIGVLQLLNKEPGKYFTPADLEILTTFASQSAIAIENARLYQSLREERDRIIAVEEDVRRRLARDLHDGPTQMLAAIIMSANFVKQALAHDSMEHAVQELEEMLPIAEKALSQVRTLLFDLRPVILETQGLIPALDSYAHRLRESEGLNIVLNTQGEFGRLSHNAEVAIFSVVQEAINNAKKHAHASRIDIDVMAREDRLVVTIRDNGKGFDMREMASRYDERGSLGMLNMRERADLLEGKPCRFFQARTRDVE